MELPDAPFYRRWSFILAGVIGLAAITATLGWLGLQEATPATTSTTTPPTTVASPPTTVPPSTRETTSKPDAILWQAAGDGVARSEAFRAPSVWRIEWSVDCNNFKEHGVGSFKITGDGAFEQIQIQEDRIEASGVETFRRGGIGHLIVDSVCDRWTVRVLSG